MTVNVDRSHVEIAGNTEGATVRKDDEVSTGEANRIFDAFHGEPAVTGDESEAAEVAITFKLDAPVAARVDAARHIAAGFQQGENVGERVGRDSGRSRQ
jgi:hypothetical protein